MGRQSGQPLRTRLNGMPYFLRMMGEMSVILCRRKASQPWELPGKNPAAEEVRQSGRSREHGPCGSEGTKCTVMQTVRPTGRVLSPLVQLKQRTGWGCVTRCAHGMCSWSQIGRGCSDCPSELPQARPGTWPMRGRSQEAGHGS